MNAAVNKRNKDRMKLDTEKLAILKQSMTRMESGREEAVLDSGILIRDYFTGRKKVQ